MRYLKNNLKLIISFILGIILASGITVYATSYLAKDITYTRENTNVKSVEDALNDLYRNKKETTNIDSFYFLVWSGVNNGFYYSNYQDYKYFRITETESGTSNSLSLTKYNWSNNGISTSLSLNTKYEITSDNKQIVIQPNSGYRNIKIEFFK